MAQAAKGRQYQDTVFRAYMNDADRLRDVAGALHGKTYAANEEIQIMTLEGTFLSQLKNDISFLIEGCYLILIEHQSTWNPNMPLRCLYYICEQFRKLVDAKKLYQNARIKLPAPEFHVFYLDDNDARENYRLKLSDAYMTADETVFLELIVLCHNIAYDSGKELLQKSRALHDYSLFVACVKKNIAQGMKRASAIRAAMRYCQENDIMRDFLEAHESEVIDMVNFEWNQKDFEEAIREDSEARGLARGIALGREEGREAEQASFIMGMLKEKLPLETIARVSKLSVERIQELGRMHSLL